MPDIVDTPPADAPALLTDAQITEEAVTKGMEAAAREEAPPAVADPPEDAPDADTPPADEPPADAPPADEPPADTPQAEEPPADAPPELPPEPLTDEEQDRAEAKGLGFKNLKATEEFVRMRAEIRTLAPLKAELEETKPLADRWTKVYQYCQGNNIDADRFAQGMAMIAGTQSQDVSILEKTLGGLEMEADRIRQKLGIGGGSYDPLKDAANADLARAVENEEMTPQWAQQQARQRAEIAHRSSLEQTQRQTQQEQQRLNQSRTEAIAELDAIGAEYAALDPHFQQKSDILVAALKPVFARLPPDQWAGAFRQAYQEMKLPANQGVPAARAPASAPLRNQPLRPGAPAALQAREIKTEDDAFQEAMRAAAQIDGVPYRASA